MAVQDITITSPQRVLPLLAATEAEANVWAVVLRRCVEDLEALRSGVEGMEGGGLGGLPKSVEDIVQLGEWLLPSGSREEQPRPSSSEGDGGEVELIRSPSSPSSSSSSHHRRAAEEEALCILLLTIHTYKQPISVFAQQLHERYNNSAAREVAYVLLRWAQLHPSHFKQNSILRTLWQRAATDGHLHEFGLKVGGSTASTSAEQMHPDC